MVTRHSNLALGALFVTALALSGCYVGPAPGDYYVGGTVTAAPATPQVEVAIGVAPGPGYFWAPGYWGWAGGRYVWSSGHWMPGRSAGWHYAPAHWVRYGGGWRMAGSHWERR